MMILMKMVKLMRMKIVMMTRRMRKMMAVMLTVMVDLIRILMWKRSIRMMEVILKMERVVVIQSNLSS